MLIPCCLFESPPEDNLKKRTNFTIFWFGTSVLNQSFPSYTLAELLPGCIGIFFIPGYWTAFFFSDFILYAKAILLVTPFYPQAINSVEIFNGKFLDSFRIYPTFLFTLCDLHHYLCSFLIRFLPLLIT